MVRESDITSYDQIKHDWNLNLAMYSDHGTNLYQQSVPVTLRYSHPMLRLYMGVRPALLIDSKSLNRQLQNVILCTQICIYAIAIKIHIIMEELNQNSQCHDSHKSYVNTPRIVSHGWLPLTFLAWPEADAALRTLPGFSSPPTR